MVEDSVIKLHYAAMTEGELMNFATEEGSRLTKEAFSILKKEFINRKMNTYILEAIQDGTLTEHKQSIDNIEKIEFKEFSTTVLSYALNEKRDGKTNDEIVSGLIETGLSENNALILIAQLDRHAHHLLDKSKSGLLSAVFIFMAGIAVYMISPKKTVIGFTGILSICAIFFGSIYFFINLFNKNKYVRVISNLNEAKGK